MKKILPLVFMILILSGCINHQFTDEYTFNEFMIQYKANNMSNIGVAGAKYNDRIYYFSQESGKSGIHSMKTDGSDICLEVEAKDIQKLQLRDEELYYLYYDGISYGESDARWGNKSYLLKSKDLKSGDKKEYYDIENKVRSIITKYREDAYRGLWDFYYLGEDYFLVGCLDPQIPTMQFILVNNKIKADGTVYDLSKEEDIYLKEAWSFGLHREGFDDYFIADSGTLTDTGINVTGFSVYNSISDSGFTVKDSVIKGKEYIDIFFKEDNNLIMRSQNCIAEYNLDSKKVTKSCIIDKAEQVFLFDKKYILAKFRNREEIYSFDKENFTAQKLLSNKKGHIVDIRDDYYILIDKKYLYKKKISGEEVWKIKLGKNYIKNEVKAEVTGDWLFIKSFDIKTESSNLDEKINLKDGKRVELDKAGN